MNPKVLLLIPARGGSKGIPRKNLLELQGKTLLQRTCELALSINPGLDVVCSTDDLEIASAAKSYGADVPFLRPKNLALDNSSTADVIIHAISELSERNRNYDYVILLEVTSQLTRKIDVTAGFDALVSDSSFSSLITIAKSESGHPLFTFSHDTGSGEVMPYLGKPWKTIRRQDVDPLYFIDGSFYISRVDSFLEHKSFVQSRTMGFLVPKWQSFEIDDPTDLIIVDAIMKHKKNIGEFPDV